MKLKVLITHHQKFLSHSKSSKSIMSSKTQQRRDSKKASETLHYLHFLRQKISHQLKNGWEITILLKQKIVHWWIQILIWLRSHSSIVWILQPYKSKSDNKNYSMILQQDRLNKWVQLIEMQSIMSWRNCMHSRTEKKWWRLSKRF